MNEWVKGGRLGSLRRRVAHEVHEHCRTNASLRRERYSLTTRFLRKALGERSLASFIVLYVVFLAAMIIVEAFMERMAPHLIPSWSADAAIKGLLKDISSYMLGAQVTMIGLLFPVAIALVTLITQREDATSTISDIQVYYDESLSYRIGASCIALTIVLAVQLFWPAQFALHQLGLGSSLQFFKVALTAVHGAWLVVNLAALWHFLSISLSFIRPSERAGMRRRFAANKSIPRDLTQRLTTALYINAASTLIPDASQNEDGGPKVFFGWGLGDFGESEVRYAQHPQGALSDVWMTPLGWVLRRWHSRTESTMLGRPAGIWRLLAAIVRLLRLRDHWLPQPFRARFNPRTRGRWPREPAPTLAFMPNIGQPLAEDAVLCRRRGGPPLTALERLIVRMSFRFERPAS